MQLKVDLAVIFVLLFLCGISTGSTQSLEFHQEWLKKGWEAEKKGEYEKALDIWFEGRVRLRSALKEIINCSIFLNKLMNLISPLAR